jgi:peptidoglycan hydrolase-like protein with peptidoglycan-binding domain
MSWRVAKSLTILQGQINAQWPNRGKGSDGTIGDESHSSRASDHNPDEFGVVRGEDFTHDPGHGFDSYRFADLILKKQDPRLKYVISNRRIGSGPAGPAPGVWRDYHGANPHDHHCHISVMPRKPNGQDPGDDIRPWDLSGVVTVADPQFKPLPPTIRVGAASPDVERLQRALGVKITGKFEPLSETEFALKLLQVRNGLIPDGIAGPQTWKIIATIEKPA